MNQSYISAKLNLLQQSTIRENLFDGDGNDIKGWLPFYDLSGYDTCTHAGCGIIYDEFCRAAFDDWDRLEGTHFKDFDIIFPLGVSRKALICRQKVSNRSTQSGQPDVTVKNNVVHLLLLAHCINVALSRSSTSRIKPSAFEVFKQLISGEGPIDGLTSLMHGDDAGIYFSKEKQDYYAFYEEMTLLGIKTSSEQFSIYLKKTPDISISNSDYGSQIDSLANTFVKYARQRIKTGAIIEPTDSRCIGFSKSLRSIMNSARSKRANLQKHSSTHDAIQTVVEAEYLSFQKERSGIMLRSFYNLNDSELKTLIADLKRIDYSTKRSNIDIDPIAGMQGIPGSLSRNRFGEYGSKEVIISLLSLLDTWPMLEYGISLGQKFQWLSMAYFVFRSPKGRANFERNFYDTDKVSNVSKKGSRIYKKDVPGLCTKSLDLIQKIYQDLDASSGSKFSSLSLLIGMFNDPEFKKSLLHCVTYVTMSAQVKAKSLRGWLDRLYYSSGEQMLDSELEQIYGSIQYDPTDLSDRLGLASWKFDDVLALCLKYQEWIFDNNGAAPTDFADIDTTNLKDLLKYQ